MIVSNAVSLGTMTRRFRQIAIASALAAAAVSATANVTKAQEATMAIDLDAAVYQASPLFPGVETAIVFGDRSEPGLYATHARVAAGAVIPPHTHPNALTTWVTSGTAYVGTGVTMKMDALKAYPAGTFFVTPAGSPHFIVAKDGAFSILDHGSAPSGLDILSE